MEISPTFSPESPPTIMLSGLSSQLVLLEDTAETLLLLLELSFYGVPKFLSGLASLVLNKAEKDILHHHYKQSLERLQSLHKATPEPVICFLGGSLPLTALLDLRQISLFGMVSRL